MSYFQSSPLIRHELDSLLPFQVKHYESKPFLKTRQFYKPEQFIWNNPHRTSDNLYKFYHKYNDHYEKNKAPLIQQLQIQDRQEKESNRIQKLTSLRHETRKRFLTRQKDRQTLEMLSGTRENTARQNHSSTTATKRYSTVLHYRSKPTMNQPMVPPNLPSKIPLKKSNSLVKNLQKTYLTALEKSDLKRNKISNMILSETHRNQNTLRIDFEKQKELNSKRMSRISKFQVSNLDLKSVTRQA